MKQKTARWNQSINDQLSTHFKQYMEKHLSLYDNLVALVPSFCHLENPAILDIGCGPGILLKRMHSINQNGPLIGIDPSIEMLKTAEKTMNNKTNLFLIRGRSENIPLQSNSIDVVISRFSLCYWDDPKQSLQELYRVLTPGGYLIIESLNKDFSKFKLFLIKTNMNLHQAKHDVIKYHADSYDIAYTNEEIKTLLSDQSFILTRQSSEKNNWKQTIIAQKPKK